MNEISQKSHGKELVCNLLLPGSLICCSAESGSTICCSLVPSVVRCSLQYRDANSTWGRQSESPLTSGISGVLAVFHGSAEDLFGRKFAPKPVRVNVRRPARQRLSHLFWT